jgi:hypothetical protein
MDHQRLFLQVQSKENAFAPQNAAFEENKFALKNFKCKAVFCSLPIENIGVLCSFNSSGILTNFHGYCQFAALFE